MRSKETRREEKKNSWKEINQRQTSGSLSRRMKRSEPSSGNELINVSSSLRNSKGTWWVMDDNNATLEWKNDSDNLEFK